jgi:periplasmic divalent cation tolerance protein
MSTSLVYVTTKNFDEAERIGETLVTERLVASVNILGEVRSMYRWEKEIHNKKEMLLIAKTSTLRVDEIIDRIRSLHSYQCPCIVAWRLEKGNNAYLDWVRKETTP